MLAIVNTFDDKQNHISRTNFQKLIVSLCALSPADAEIKKQAFLERIEKYFGGNEHISISRLYILLNDNFINELVFLDNDSRQDTIRKTCQKYKTGQPNNVVNQGHLTMLTPNTTSTNNSK